MLSLKHRKITIIYFIIFDQEICDSNIHDQVNSLVDYACTPWAKIIAHVNRYQGYYWSQCSLFFCPWTRVWRGRGILDLGQGSKADWNNMVISMNIALKWRFQHCVVISMAKVFIELVCLNDKQGLYARVATLVHPPCPTLGAHHTICIKLCVSKVLFKSK